MLAHAVFGDGDCIHLVRGGESLQHYAGGGGVSQPNGMAGGFAEGGKSWEKNPLIEIR